MSLARVMIRASVAMVFAALALAVSNASASAADCVWTDHAGEYKCVVPADQPGPGTPAVPTAGSAPSCDVTSASPATFCWGSSPCYYTDSVVPLAPPSTPPPAPGATWHARMCLLPDELVHGTGQPVSSSWQGTALWVGQALEPPPLIDQAREAFGRIVLPAATLAFNPTNRTLVNLDTWFWAQGLTIQQLQGTSAFGLVAIATPARLTVTTGDGSAPFTCTWATAKSDRCSYPYLRSSVGGSARGPSGEPAYQASATATWTLRFENNGTPVTIAGAPTELTGPSMTTAVEVAEVQTIVTRAG